MSELAHASRVVNPLIDRLLRLRRPDRETLFESTASALQRFPMLDRFDRTVLLRRIAINDVRNRLIFRFITLFPATARLVTRLVPFAGNVQLIASAPAGRPLLLAFMHFGPPHVLITATMPLLRGRRAYVLHAGGITGRASAAYFRSIGAIPVLTDRRALETVSAAIARDPHCAVFVFFDHLSGRGRRSVEFLGAEIRVPTGIAYLARVHRAIAITGWWDFEKRLPRAYVGEAYESNPDLEPSITESELIDRLFRSLEERVVAAPQEWTEWPNCFAADAT